MLHKSQLDRLQADACLPDDVSSQLRFAVVDSQNRQPFDFSIRSDNSIHGEMQDLQSEKLAASLFASPTNRSALPNF